jgi:hypothetical protein
MRRQRVLLSCACSLRSSCEEHTQNHECGINLQILLTSVLLVAAARADFETATETGFRAGRFVGIELLVL